MWASVPGQGLEVYDPQVPLSKLANYITRPSLKYSGRLDQPSPLAPQPLPRGLKYPLHRYLSRGAIVIIVQVLGKHMSHNLNS